MMKKLLPVMLFYTVTLAAQTIPASPNVFASAGDLTYCQLTKASTTKPILALTCRRAGVTKFTATTIADSMIITVGDVAWELKLDNSDPLNPKFNYFAAVWDRTITPNNNHMASQGVMQWTLTARQARRNNRKKK